MTLFAVPMNIGEACEFVRNFHRHNKPPLSGLFAVGVSNGDTLCGVAIVGRPIARMLQDSWTAEVIRTCVRPEVAPKGANSFLYARCWQAAKALGFKRLVTYTLAAESGASLRGAGWKIVGEVTIRNKPWHGPDRAREWQPVYGQAKFRWEAA